MMTLEDCAKRFSVDSMLLKIDFSRRIFDRRVLRDRELIFFHMFEYKGEASRDKRMQGADKFAARSATRIMVGSTKSHRKGKVGNRKGRGRTSHCDSEPATQPLTFFYQPCLNSISLCHRGNQSRSSAIESSSKSSR